MKSVISKVSDRVRASDMDMVWDKVSGRVWNGVWDRVWNKAGGSHWQLCRKLGVHQDELADVWS